MVTTPRAEAYNLTEFIADLEAAKREETDTEKLVERIKACLQELLKKPDFLREDQKAVATDGKSQSSLLYLAPDGKLSVRAVVFPEGKPTPIHDHLTWGMVGVYEGQEREGRYQRVDDGSREGYAQLIDLGKTIYQPGQVTSFIPPNDIHTVEAVSPVKSV
ncbi:MAG TPA: cysteine dioxygenase family protein, partial [Dehalococcoidia bacterium]|nr:cysteine dioxygenase family protein [Dehalococcoidia bacterium]